MFYTQLNDKSVTIPKPSCPPIINSKPLQFIIRTQENNVTPLTVRIWGTTNSQLTCNKFVNGDRIKFDSGNRRIVDKGRRNKCTEVKTLQG